MMFSTDTELGNFATRSWRAGSYVVRPAGLRNQLENAIRANPANARYLTNQWAAIARVEGKNGIQESTDQARRLLAQVESEAREMDARIRAALQNAKNDGHGITIEENSAGLGAFQIVFVAVAAALIGIIAAYVGFEEFLSSRNRHEQTKQAYESYIAAGRLDLIDRDLGRQSNPTGGVSNAISNIGTAAVLGGLAFLYFIKRARR